jgi:hypothetical protein
VNAIARSSTGAVVVVGATVVVGNVVTTATSVVVDAAPSEPDEELQAVIARTSAASATELVVPKDRERLRIVSGPVACT